MVSIIVPIYNPGDKLCTCLSSIQTQSYPDIEVLMINDGSTDNSAAICKEFADTDSRFIYIEQNNGGVSSARNKGITNSHGDYICFVDSDDSVSPRYVECMVSAMETTHADIVLQGLINIYDGRAENKKEFPNLSIAVNKLNDGMFEDLFYFCGPYCKLFRSDYVKDNKILFPEDLSYGEDFVFYSKYLHFCKIISFVADTLYNYSVSVANSLSSVKLSPEKFWANQVNRRGEYKKLRKEYGIENNFYPTENRIKLVALRGLLSTIKHGDSDLKTYLNLVKSNDTFGFSEIRSSKLSDRFLLHLIRLNNCLSRFILHIIIK